MIFSNHYSFRKTLFLTISLIITFFISESSFAQVSSIKELKNNVQILKEKGISVKPGDPWTIDRITTPNELSTELSDAKAKKPVIYHVGFDFLYKQGHIPGSIYAEPASSQQGLDKIKNEVKDIKRDQHIVIHWRWPSMEGLSKYQAGL